MDFYLIAVVVLFALAISDLMVGVSNDAVNFLNSAIGSKVASRRTIMVVASLGIFIGATFSSGMMEIARKGIFNPEHFFLAEIMVIFLAVMITDIILLDLFNTFGMPTSTTVSIVFELLGAAVVVALIKISAAGEGFVELARYINTEKALLIIAGIVLSVVVAFTIGVIVQYVSRLLFSFGYQKRMKRVGAVWAGFALTALSYFLVIKGIKGASFVSDTFVGWINANTTVILLILFAAWTLVAQALIWLRVNILSLIVLLGTFALAMAFAGNDLVNFIGVPIAGFESFMAWTGSGVAADAFTMESLTEPVRTDSLLLLAAGLIMVLTLWFSKKARSVTETEVNLGRQNEGHERFTPNGLSRMIVRVSRDGGRLLTALIPRRWLRAAEANFTPVERAPSKDPDPPAFDLVRASVNLTVASMLIALATSLKLPLSTTYVSFMVAMGASLADRAWDRESAVYRVAGVLNVIGGWFLTAVVAFSVSGLFALLIHTFGALAVAALLGVAIFSIFRSIVVHRRREREKEERLRTVSRAERLTHHAALEETTKGIAHALSAIRQAYEDALNGLFEENLGKLRQARQSIKALKRQNEILRSNLPQYILRIDEAGAESSRMYLMFYDIVQDILQSSEFIVGACNVHVQNCHKPLTRDQTKALVEMREQIGAYLHAVETRVQQNDFEEIGEALDEKDQLLRQLGRLFEQHVEGVKAQAYGSKNTHLFVSLLLESKDLAAIAARFLKFYHRHLIPEPVAVV